MPVAMVRVDGADLRAETIGDRGAPPILLVAGAGESMEAWDRDVCVRLAGERRLVIRYDQRDTGRSTARPPGAAAPALHDLAGDAVRLIDVLAGGRAHVVASPAGGAIAQALAGAHPDRVATLTLIPPGAADADVPAILRRTDHRVRFAHVFEAEARAHEERFRAAWHIRPGDRVLDIGCGTGGSTREAARMATAGSVVGVDISGVAIAEARRRTEEEGLRNVTYVDADAQIHRFPPAHVDLCISRFGVMFFADPRAAFANIRRALRPGARLAFLVWQRQDRNEATEAIRRALGAPPPETAIGAEPFSLGDPPATERILAAAGFTDVAFDDVHEPIFYGADVETAYEFVLGLQDTRERLAALEPGGRRAARDRLRALLAAHETDGGVLFDARTWIITARRRP